MDNVLRDRHKGIRRDAAGGISNAYFQFIYVFELACCVMCYLKNSTLKSEDFRLRDPEGVNAVKWALKYREFTKLHVIYRHSLCSQDRVHSECRITSNVSMILDPRKKLEKHFKEENCQCVNEQRDAQFL